MSKDALAHLKKSDPAFADLIRRVGPCRFVPNREGTHFEALLRSIVYQQLSGKAAGTIHGRVRALFEPGAPAPESILAMPEDRLRGAGLSRPKIASVRSLAERWLADPLPEALDHLADEAIIDALTSVRGIGRWSAQMFLMFRLGRPDVLPTADLGIQKGIQRLDRLTDLPKPADVERRAAPWRPYATIASWYLWRSLELPDA